MKINLINLISKKTPISKLGFEIYLGQLRIRVIRNLILIGLILTGSLLIYPNRTNAQELSIGVDPPIIQIDATSPALVNTAITVQNLSDQSISYNIFLVPFKSSDAKNGETEFDKTLNSDYKNIFGKIRVIENSRVITQIKLAPKQSKQIILRIALPKGEKPADYYFSVLFISGEGSNSNENSFVGARAGIATNVLLSIGPKSQSTGFIREFSSPRLVTRGPIGLTLNLANTSSHYVTINGNVVIKNIFNQTVGNINLVPVNILSHSERYIESEDNQNPSTPQILWNEKFLLGIYKADLNVALSQDGPVLKKEITFFAFPFEVILGIGVAIILIIGIIKRVRSKALE